MKALRRWLQLGCIAALLHAVACHAQSSAEIVERCIYDIGEFGAEAVDICVKQDQAAEKALRSYPPEAAPLIDACTKRAKAGGWVMIQRCVDRQLAAPPPDR
jgi:hypothetical protein